MLIPVTTIFTLNLQWAQYAIRLQSGYSGVFLGPAFSHCTLNIPDDHPQSKLPNDLTCNQAILQFSHIEGHTNYYLLVERFIWKFHLYCTWETICLFNIEIMGTSWLCKTPFWAQWHPFVTWWFTSMPALVSKDIHVVKGLPMSMVALKSMTSLLVHRHLDIIPYYLIVWSVTSICNPTIPIAPVFSLMLKILERDGNRGAPAGRETSYPHSKGNSDSNNSK